MMDILHSIIWQGREYIGWGIYGMPCVIIVAAFCSWYVYHKRLISKLAIPVAFVVFFVYGMYASVKPPPPPPPGPTTNNYWRIYARPEWRSHSVTNRLINLKPHGSLEMHQ